ncbi:MAG: PIN domain-containing protein [Tannerellaceae bacterium]|jgi:predicted nucleic-acid-binding protein|nr:PIN domain-containing protein [Tannerellaceae bacterium]
MVLLDTNAIVRYLLQDNAEMAEAVKKELNAEDCHITVEVVAETVYVLSKVYKVERHLIAKTLEGVVETSDSLVAEPEVVLHAGLIYASTNLDFIDCLLVGYAKIKGHKVFTFDKALKKRL